MCCKHYHIIFSTFSLKFKCKICVQKEVIHNFKNHILVMWPNLIIFWKQNHITVIFIKNDVTWPLSANDLLAFKQLGPEIIHMTTKRPPDYHLILTWWRDMAKLGIQTRIELKCWVRQKCFSVGVVSLLDFGFTLWELNQINSHSPW